MNEKIKRFAINSQLVSVCDLHGTLVSGWQEGVDLTEYLEDFAKMIVKECVSIAETGLAPAVATVITEHFGLTEDERKNPIP